MRTRVINSTYGACTQRFLRSSFIRALVLPFLERKSKREAWTVLSKLLPPAIEFSRRRYTRRLATTAAAANSAGGAAGNNERADGEKDIQHLGV
jgi:hypothetical protein